MCCYEVHSMITRCIYWYYWDQYIVFKYLSRLLYHPLYMVSFHVGPYLSVFKWFIGYIPKDPPVLCIIWMYCINTYYITFKWSSLYNFIFNSITIILWFRIWFSYIFIFLYHIFQRYHEKYYMDSYSIQKYVKGHSNVFNIKIINFGRFLVFSIMMLEVIHRPFYICSDVTTSIGPPYILPL